MTRSRARSVRDLVEGLVSPRTQSSEAEESTTQPKDIHSNDNLTNTSESPPTSGSPGSPIKLQKRPSFHTLNPEEFVQKNFSVPSSISVIADFPCSHLGKENGRMFVTQSHLCFASVSAKSKDIQIAFDQVIDVRKKNSSFFLPNALEVTVKGSEQNKHLFTSIADRDDAFEILKNTWLSAMRKTLKNHIEHMDQEPQLRPTATSEVELSQKREDEDYNPQTEPIQSRHLSLRPASSSKDKVQTRSRRASSAETEPIIRISPPTAAVDENSEPGTKETLTHSNSVGDLDTEADLNTDDELDELTFSEMDDEQFDAFAHTPSEPSDTHSSRSSKADIYDSDLDSKDIFAVPNVKFKTIMKQEFPVSVHQFYHLILSNLSSSTREWHRQCGDLDISVDPWGSTVPGVPHIRSVQFTTQKKSGILMPSKPKKEWYETQRMLVGKENNSHDPMAHIIIHSSILPANFSKGYQIEMKVYITNRKTSTTEMELRKMCRVEIMIGVNYLKPAFRQSQHRLNMIKKYAKRMEMWKDVCQHTILQFVNGSDSNQCLTALGVFRNFHSASQTLNTAQSIQAALDSPLTGTDSSPAPTPIQGGPSSPEHTGSESKAKKTKKKKKSKKLKQGTPDKNANDDHYEKPKKKKTARIKSPSVSSSGDHSNSNFLSEYTHQKESKFWIAVNTIISLASTSFEYAPQILELLKLVPAEPVLALLSCFILVLSCAVQLRVISRISAVESNLNMSMANLDANRSFMLDSVGDYQLMLAQEGRENLRLTQEFWTKRFAKFRHMFSTSKSKELETMTIYDVEYLFESVRQDINQEQGDGPSFHKSKAKDVNPTEWEAIQYFANARSFRVTMMWIGLLVLVCAAVALHLLK